jgi:hypothetical protein
VARHPRLDPRRVRPRGGGQAKSADVTTSDTTSFLPSRYESARAARFGREAFGQVYAATGVVVALASLLGFTLD